MDAGRVVQLGTHAELVAAEGPYRRLWQIQTDLEAELDRDLESAAPDATREPQGLTR